MIRSEHMTISVNTRKVTSLNGGGIPTNKSNGIYLELIVSMVMINGKQNISCNNLLFTALLNLTDL